MYYSTPCMADEDIWHVPDDVTKPTPAVSSIASRMYAAAARRVGPTRQ